MSQQLSYEHRANEAKSHSAISELQELKKEVTELKEFFNELKSSKETNYNPKANLEERLIKFERRISKQKQYSSKECIELVGMTNKIDREEHIGMILVDLQKAFDTLGHGILLEKMKYFGFWVSVIIWFESYLSNRKFFVCIDVFSEAGALKYRVPQGSILAPLLFLLYVNDLLQSLSDAGSYLFMQMTPASSNNMRY